MSAQYHVIFDDMFTTVAAVSDTDKKDVWKGLYKSSPCLDVLGTFNDDKFNNESPRTSPTSQKPKEHPLQTHLKIRIAESKGNAKVQYKDNSDTILSKGAPKEYNRTAKCNLSLLNKRVKSSLKSKVSTFQDPPKPSARHRIVAKNAPLRRSKRIRKLSSKDRKLMTFQAATSLLANKKPNRIKFQEQCERLMG
eukprot:4017386-Ditylum_brightwellii.AAC.1